MALDTRRRAELGAFSLPSRHGETLSRVDPRGTAADAETASATHQFKLPKHRKWVSDSPPESDGRGVGCRMGICGLGGGGYIQSECLIIYEHVREVLVWLVSM